MGPDCYMLSLILQGLLWDSLQALSQEVYCPGSPVQPVCWDRQVLYNLSAYHASLLRTIVEDDDATGSASALSTACL